MVVLITTIASTISVSALSGKGTQSNPFRISTEEELLLLADFPDCYFELENDIEVTSKWRPVAEFSGQLDGKGNKIIINKISSVSYAMNSNYYVGFVKLLSGCIKNVSFVYNGLDFVGTIGQSISSEDRYYDVSAVAIECSGSINNCSATGSFGKTSFKYSNFSGLVCVLKEGASITNSYTDVLLNNVQTDSIANRICGILYQNDGMVRDCYSFIEIVTKSDATPNYYGVSGSNNGTIQNCYAVGKGGYHKYGIATKGTMTNCYYDKVVLGNSSTSYGIPKSTIAMKMEATYSGWDFENTWAIDESEENPINDGYPYLKAMYGYPEQPITVTSAKAVDGNLVFDTKITDVADTYMLHIALYDSTNALCGYLIIPNERELKDVFAVFADNGKATSAKVFVWNESNKITPVAQSETVSIAR